VSAAAAAPAASGRSHPLGPTIVQGGVNFSIFSRGATAVDLLFFDSENDGEPSRVISMDPAVNRSYHYWHVFVPGAQHGQIYGLRAHGPFDPSSGSRFDPSKLLLDPYGRAVAVPKDYRREGSNIATAMASASHHGEEVSTVSAQFHSKAAGLAQMGSELQYLVAQFQCTATSASSTH